MENNPYMSRHFKTIKASTRLFSPLGPLHLRDLKVFHDFFINLALTM